MKEIMRIWCQNLVHLSPWIGEEMKSKDKNVDAILVVMMSQPRWHLFIIMFTFHRRKRWPRGVASSGGYLQRGEHQNYHKNYFVISWTSEWWQPWFCIHLYKLFHIVIFYVPDDVYGVFANGAFTNNVGITCLHKHYSHKLPRTTYSHDWML